jgi:hypothetical protein
MEASVQPRAPVALPQGNGRPGPSAESLGGPQSLSGCCEIEKVFPPVGNRTLDVRHEAPCYTDWAIPASNSNVWYSSLSVANIGPFWAIGLLRIFCQITSGFHYSRMRNSIFLRVNFDSIVPNPQPRGPGFCINFLLTEGGPITHPGTWYKNKETLHE